jgi:hypothetical protein
MGEGRRRRNLRGQNTYMYPEPSADKEEWRATSPTVRYLEGKIKANFGKVRRGLETARYSAISSGKDAKLKLFQYIKVILV